MFNEKEVGSKVAPIDFGRLLFERRAGMRDWNTGKIMPEYAGQIAPIVGVDDPVESPKEAEPQPEEKTEEEEESTETPKKRGRPSKN